MNPNMLPFNMLNFPLLRTLVLGSMHAALAYKAQRLKMQKLADWKPALSIRKQNSKHYKISAMLFGRVFFVSLSVPLL